MAASLNLTFASVDTCQQLVHDGFDCRDHIRREIDLCPHGIDAGNQIQPDVAGSGDGDDKNQ